MLYEMLFKFLSKVKEPFVAKFPNNLITFTKFHVDAKIYENRYDTRMSHKLGKSNFG